MADVKQETTKFPKIILGTMEFGRQFNEEAAFQVTKEFLNRNHKELDTAYIYSKGTPHSETTIGNMRNKLLIPHNASVSTKVSPKNCNLTPRTIRRHFNESLKRLRVSCVDILYLHYPDGTVPIFDTLQCINELYKENKFKRFGVSNYAAWQVVEIYYLCEHNGFVVPTVYQGLYNAISRDIETELIPCLKRFNICFYAYNILGGGVLTGKHKYQNLENNTMLKGRFQSSSYKRKFWYKEIFDGIELIQKALNKVYGKGKVSIIDASLRWIRFHSVLSNNNKNGVLIGAGSYQHFVSNLDSLENKKALHKDVLAAFEDAWALAKRNRISYVASHTEPFYTLSIQEELRLKRLEISSIFVIDRALEFINQYDVTK